GTSPRESSLGRARLPVIGGARAAAVAALALYVSPPTKTTTTRTFKGRTQTDRTLESTNDRPDTLILALTGASLLGLVIGISNGNWILALGGVSAQRVAATGRRAARNSDAFVGTAEAIETLKSRILTLESRSTLAAEQDTGASDDIEEDAVAAERDAF